MLPKLGITPSSSTATPVSPNTDFSKVITFGNSSKGTAKGLIIGAGVAFLMLAIFRRIKK